MKTTKLIAILLVLGMCSFSAFSQEYKTAFGARLGYPLAASFKYFHNESNAIEVYAGSRGYSTYRWFNASVAYQIHKPTNIGGLEALYYYFGAGGSVFFWNFDNVFIGDSGTTTSFGIQGYLGLDYAFHSLPINISVDWIPTFFLNGFDSGFGAGFGTFAVRYVISQ